MTKFSIGHKVVINSNIVVNNKTIINKNTEAVIINNKNSYEVDLLLLNNLYRPLLVFNMPIEYLNLVDTDINSFNLKNVNISN